MMLLLDMGNTRIKWARLVDGKLTEQGSAVHLDEQLNPSLQRALEGPKPERVLACNVAGPLIGKALSELSEERFGIHAEFLIS